MLLQGRGGSSGEIVGFARVITDLNQALEMKPGEILIAKITSPSWTPLIHAAKAIVTEVGGTLSHAAIVSREYGIPAVVGVKHATAKIKTGQQIKVDGSRGIVEIL